MKTWSVLLGTLVCYGTVIADDAIVELSKNLGRTPALVVAVCGKDETALSMIAGLAEQTP